MRHVEREISRELYENYMSRPVAEWKAEVRKNVPIEWICGYGYYGTDLVARDGKYYLVHTIGSSCD